MSKPLLLLAAPSHESRDKAARLRAAAEALGMPARMILGDRPEIVEAKAGDEKILLAIACSDALALPAARLNDRHGCGGISAALIGQLSDKATAIPLLSDILGLPLLPQCLPQEPEDIVNWSWTGPIFVKPTRSSGGWSPRPWGYRCFGSKSHFMQWLREEGLLTGFFAEQRQPTALGPSLLQAAQDGQCEGVILLLTPSHLQVIGRIVLTFESDDAGMESRSWRRITCDSKAAAEIVDRLPLLDQARRGDPAWGRGILYVQGLRGREDFRLIDINMRLSTGFDCIAAVADPTMHRRLLASLLFDVPFDASLPAPDIAIDLVNGDPIRRIKAIDHPPLPAHILPLRLSTADCGSAVGGFDKGGVMPCFVTLGSDFESCMNEADGFRAGIRLHYAEDTAP